MWSLLCYYKLAICINQLRNYFWSFVVCSARSLCEWFLCISVDLSLNAFLIFLFHCLKIQKLLKSQSPPKKPKSPRSGVIIVFFFLQASAPLPDSGLSPSRICISPRLRDRSALRKSGTHSHRCLCSHCFIFASAWGGDLPGSGSLMANCVTVSTSSTTLRH